MRLLSTRAAPFLALIAWTLGACSDHLSPTHPTPDDANRAICVNCGGDGGDGGDGGGGPPPPPPAALTGVTLQSGTWYIIGGTVSYSVNLRGGPLPLTGMSVSSKLTQPTGSLVVTSAPVTCGTVAGTLPSSATCTMNLPAGVVGGGLGLVPGAATFEVDLKQGSTTLSSQAFIVTIENAAPQVTGINAGASPLLITLAPKSFTATLFNPFASRPDLIQINGYIRQNSHRVWVGGQPVNCGSGFGVLPSGSCTTSSSYAFTDNTLVPGPAIFEVDLVNGQNLLQDSTSISVTLIRPPSVNNGSAPSDVTLSVAVPGGFNVQLLNDNSTALPNSMTVKAVLTQGSLVARTVGSAKVACAGSDGTATGMPAGPGRFCSFAGQVLVNTGIVDLSVDKGTLTATPEGTPSSIEFWVIDDASGGVVAKGGSQFVLLHSPP